MSTSLSSFGWTTITSMTTLFTPPPDCLIQWTYEPEYFNQISGGVLRPNILNDPQYLASCYPSGVTAIGLGPGNSPQIFSPGVCPVGYATNERVGLSSTTVAVCCPTSYEVTSTWISFIDSHLTASTSVTFYRGCMSTLNVFTSVLARVGDSSFLSTSLNGPVLKWAWPLLIEWQEKDLVLFRSASTTQPKVVTTFITTNIPSRTVTSYVSRSKGFEEESPSLPNNTSAAAATVKDTATSGLSPGVLGGIATGAAVSFVLFFIFPIVLIVRHKRRTQENSDAEPNEKQDSQSSTTQTGEKDKKCLELDPQWVTAELDCSKTGHEMDGQARFYELDSTPRRFEVFSPG